MQQQSFQNIDKNKLQKLIEIKAGFLTGKISEEVARKQIQENYTTISPEEFAYTEQVLKDEGFSDDVIHAQMETLLGLLDGVLVKTTLDLPQGHPLRTYQEENIAIKRILSLADQLIAQSNFEKNLDELKAIYDDIFQFNTHLSRKQNQLFPKLEEKGFDRPSKIMWSFDNEVKNAISNVRSIIAAKNWGEIVDAHKTAKTAILDIIDKEETILYPTSLKLIFEQEFVHMRKGDDEIGYCLIENPPAFGQEEHSAPNGDFMQELAALVNKSQPSSSDVLDVKQGKLTLEQINLIFQHLPIDLSFVDENELVKFYSDTTHRVFPRSPNVIGRNVMNCHPRESLDVVTEIIDSFRQGKQDKAEFWLEMGDKFIYILYTAVRNDKGEFKGVLEMMQEASHIRSLQGSRKLLQWDNTDSAQAGTDNNIKNNKEDNMSNKFRFIYL